MPLEYICSYRGLGTEHGMEIVSSLRTLRMKKVGALDLVSLQELRKAGAWSPFLTTDPPISI